MDEGGEASSGVSFRNLLVTNFFWGGEFKKKMVQLSKWH